MAKPKLHPCHKHQQCDVIDCDNPTGNNPWRCSEHHQCDDCGTREKIVIRTEGVLCDPCFKIRVDARIASFKGSTDYTNEVVCPHCGYTFSDSWEMSEGEYNCHDCERKFELTRNVEVTYSTEKVE